MIRVLKKKSEGDELRIVWAEVYAPGMPDTDKEFMSAETIRKMAHDFVRAQKMSMIDTQHDNILVPGASVVESFVARKGDPDFIPDAWVVGVHIPDDLTWSKIKDGTINGFSMEAFVTKVETELELEIPEVVRGMCTKHDGDGHEHEFFVKYDPEGNLVGGITGRAADGHWHVIKRGTLTEEAKGHQHRFSFVEGLITGPK